MDEERIVKIVDGLRRKSSRSRIEGIIYIILILVVCSVILFSFVKFSGHIINLQTGDQAVIEKMTIVQGAQSKDSKLSETVGNIVLRLGAVMLAIYLVQILVGFARYRFKVAEIHSSNADALILSNGDIDKFSYYTKALSPNTDFVKMPTEPYDKVFNLVKDISSKVNLKNS